MKKLLSLCLAVCLLFSLATVAHAEAQPVAPEFAMTTPTSAAYYGVEGQEYVLALAGEQPDWSKAVEPEDGFVYFEDIQPATEYTVYTRIKGTETVASTKLVTSLISVSILGETVVGRKLTAELEPADAEGMEIQWYRLEPEGEDGILHTDLDDPIPGANGLEFTPTEAELGKVLYLVVTKSGEEVMSTSLGPVTYNYAAQFVDIDQTRDDLCIIDFVVSEGIMIGTGANTFSPNQKLNRATLMQILYNMEGKPEVPDGKGFDDVDVNAWYRDAVLWAGAEGIAQGYGDNFGPMDELTLEQLLTFLHRYAEYKGAFTETDYDLADYAKAEQVHDWSAEAVRWALQRWVLDPTGEYGPALPDSVTRFETAEVLFILLPLEMPEDHWPVYDLGESERYDVMELFQAIDAIEAVFENWNGCELHELRYAGDEACTEENLNWLKSLEPEAGFTEVAEFLCRFHTPGPEVFSAWEPDAEYYDYQWWLARAEGGEWQVVSWGY